MEVTKESMLVSFQTAYDICAARANFVRLPRVQIDLCVLLRTFAYLCVPLRSLLRGAIERRDRRATQRFQAGESVISEVNTDHTAAAFGEGAEVA